MARNIPLKCCAVMWENINLFHGFYQCEIKFNSDFSVTAFSNTIFNIWVCLQMTVYTEKGENGNAIITYIQERIFDDDKVDLEWNEA